MPAASPIRQWTLGQRISDPPRRSPNSKSLLESINAPAQMGAVEPSTELSSGLSEIERESDRLDAMYQSVQEAMHEAVRSSGLSMNPLPEFNLLTPPMSTEEPQR